MSSEITAIISGLNTAVQIVKGMHSISKSAEINVKAMELQSVILSLQSGMLSLQSRHGSLLAEKRALEEKLAGLEGWETTKSRYELKEIASGVFVYSLKQNITDETHHWLCSKCFNEGAKAILQLETQAIAGHIYFCPKCGTKICDHTKREGPIHPGKVDSDFNPLYY